MLLQAALLNVWDEAWDGGFSRLDRLRSRLPTHILAKAPWGGTRSRCVGILVARVGRSGHVSGRFTALFGLRRPDAVEVLLVRRVLAHWVGDVGLVALMARHGLDHVGRDDLLECGRLGGIALGVAGRLVGRGLVVIGPGDSVVLS